jgi:hypothetical protein
MKKSETIFFNQIGTNYAEVTKKLILRGWGRSRFDVKMRFRLNRLELFEKNIRKEETMTSELHELKL